MTTTEPKASKSEKLIYIGPALSCGRLPRYSVFIGGLPSHLEGELSRCPKLAKLFVPIGKLNEAEKELEKPGTPLHKYYAEVAKNMEV
ncbi:hypothetical protein [Phascolarctobacterium succinatutens]|uniref:hypothetical protein n=1 Tax=Phascolarctobacterium succinatutens TaxID=626940 RepID=UPI0023F40DA0|nr:hypothetical protein [Phascolarctobacterium succinatutens]